MVSRTASDGDDATSAALRKPSPVTRRTTRSPVRRMAQRRRKQTITARLSDSGIEEDLSAQSPSAGGTGEVGGTVVPQASQVSRTSAGHLGLLTWHLHYGDVGYRIQRDSEARFHLPRCLARQPQLTAEARCKLVSWLIPVHKYFRLSFECCCLAVNIMDRFLASTAVAADCFQLLGVTALLLASKQVEVFSPRISQLLGLCCNAFTKEQLCNLECLVLLRLDFRLAAPTLAFFLEYHINCGEAAQLLLPPPPHGDPDSAPPSTHRERRSATQRNNLARRICELSLADYAFSRYLPSLTAACALRLSVELLRDGGETHTQELIQSEEGKLSFGSERSESEQSSMDVAPDRSGDGHGQTEEGFGPEEDLSLSGGLGGQHSHSLAQECRENLKLLVSLNPETLQGMSMPP